MGRREGCFDTGYWVLAAAVGSSVGMAASAAKRREAVSMTEMLLHYTELYM